MQKIFTKKRFLFVFLLSFQLVAFSQNQEYWREGFEPNGAAVDCNLTTTAPTVTGGNYFTGNAGSWYGFNIYRTTGTGCPAGNNHVRYKNISGVTDSGYLVTPIVDFGIKEFHVFRARASRSFTIWITNDTLATTTNWTPVALMPSSSATITCVDTMVLINSATAKRLKIVGRPGTDSDVDSIWLTSFGAITPVKFGGLTASVIDNTVKLKWLVESEINSKEYIIERSLDGRDFSKINILAATNSSTYVSIDNSPNQGTNFYRIVAMDNDGKKQYSSTIKIITNKTQANFNIYPNPVINNLINLELSGITKGNAYKVNVYNISGKLVFTSSINAEGNSLTKSIQLPTQIKAGNYVVEVCDENFKKTKLITIN